MPRHHMVYAHIAPVLEPLLYAPAFIAVGWSLTKAWRRQPPHHKEQP